MVRSELGFDDGDLHLNYKHGMRHSKAYDVWCGMKTRCLNPKDPAFKNYGARGITICDRWLNSFAGFYADMGDPPLGKFLERVNNDKGYSPDNCTWATRLEQNRNRRNIHSVTVGSLTLPLSAWAQKLGVNTQTISQRIACGWDPRVAVSIGPIPNKLRDGGWPSMTYENYLSMAKEYAT